MARVKTGVTNHRRHKKVLKLAKGYFGGKRLLYRTAHEAVMKAQSYAFRDRRKKKDQFRKLWIARINAAARLNDLSYSKLMHGLKLANVTVNRKVLSEIAIADPKGFTAICEKAKAALAA
ncbi:MAG: 50S ribosomal protein L20 [Gammaproteobacteria bacterium]|nr:50S ribosomal protein L20 [Gammaproteobacteria bacterium]